MLPCDLDSSSDGDVQYCAASSASDDGGEEVVYIGKDSDCSASQSVVARGGRKRERGVFAFSAPNQRSKLEHIAGMAIAREAKVRHAKRKVDVQAELAVQESVAIANSVVGRGLLAKDKLGKFGISVRCKMRGEHLQPASILAIAYSPMKNLL